jgi:hypothetical protein
MVKNKKQVNKTTPTELDSTYFLKMLLYIALGVQWLWIVGPDSSEIPLPLGLFIGILFAMHDHFKIDRKIEFAILLIATLVGYMSGIGIFVGM